MSELTATIVSKLDDAGRGRATAASRRRRGGGACCGSAALAHFVLDQFDDFGEALWSAVLHVLDPSSLHDDDDAAERAIGLFQVVTGLVLLVGLLFTFVAEVVANSLERLGQTDRPVHLPRPPARRRRHRPRLGGGLGRVRGPAGDRAEAARRAGARVGPRLARPDPRRPRRGGRRGPQDRPRLRRHRRRLGLRAGRGRAGAGDPADALEQRPGPRRGGRRRGDPERPRPARLPEGAGRQRRWCGCSSAAAATSTPAGSSSRPSGTRSSATAPISALLRLAITRPPALEKLPGWVAEHGSPEPFTRLVDAAWKAALKGGRAAAADDRRLRHQRAGADGGPRRGRRRDLRGDDDRAARRPSTATSARPNRRGCESTSSRRCRPTPTTCRAA